MKRILKLVGLLCWVAVACQAPDTSNTQLEHTDVQPDSEGVTGVIVEQPPDNTASAAVGGEAPLSSFYVADERSYPSILIGVVDGQRDTLISITDDRRLSIHALYDFDEDGWTDALVKDMRGGGNGSGVSFFFVTYQPGQGFLQTQTYGYCLGDDCEPVLEQKAGKYCAKIKSHNAGAGTDDYEEFFEWITLREGKAQVVETYHVPELPALREIRARMFRQGKEDQVLRLLVDLNADGLVDTLRGTLWERWGVVQPTLVLADGRELMTDIPGCRRIGILSSRTAGFYDLVCDLNQVHRWDGQGYRLSNQ